MLLLGLLAILVGAAGVHALLLALMGAIFIFF